MSVPIASHSSLERSEAASSPRARPRHPDEAEIADGGPPCLDLALELYDVMTPADRLQGVHGAENPAPDDRHTHLVDLSYSPQRPSYQRVLRCGTTG
jgi:hypothetical protein